MPRYKEPYTLYSVKTKKGIKVWYYRTHDKNGKRTSGRCTGQTSKTLARRYCDQLMMAKELIPQPKSPTLAEWSKERQWWVWEKCSYIKGRLARSEADKPGISHRYADEALRILKDKILPAHGKKRLEAIAPEDCEKLLFSWPKKGASYKSANNWASIYRVMLAEAARLKVIDENPWSRVLSLTPSSKRRGLLTMAEARKLLNPATVDTVWDDHHLYYCINLVASLTAMRQGEILALRQGDVFPDHLHVGHSWSIKYELGKTKTKIIGDVPIPAFLYQEMERYMIWDGFVFSFSYGKRPATGGKVTDWLYRALKNIGIQEHERVERNLTFHSWRHFFNTYLRSRGVPDAKVKAVTGHKTQAMTEHYTGFQLEDYREVYEAQDGLGELIQEDSPI